MYYFEKYYGFVKKKQFFIVGEEINCIDIDDIGNVEDSPRLVFINKKCGNLIVVNDGAEPTENIMMVENLLKILAKKGGRFTSL